MAVLRVKSLEITMSGDGSQGARMGGEEREILIRQDGWGAPTGIALCLAFVAGGVAMMVFQVTVAVGIGWVAIGLIVTALFALNHTPGGIVLAADERGLVYRSSLLRIEAPWSAVLGAEIQMVDDGDGGKWPVLIVGVRDRNELTVVGRFAWHVFSFSGLATSPPWEEILRLGYNSSWIWEPEEVCAVINGRRAN